MADARILDRLRSISDAYSRGDIGLGEARNILKDILKGEGYDPHQAGMRNLASTARLNLVMRQNAAMAHSAGEWARMHDPDAMKVFPYVRYHSRGDSRSRSSHSDLNGNIYHKNDPFLKTHTPPWEFNCRCWLEEITAKEAGKEEERIQKPTPPESVTVDSDSGFAFDPEHAFETFEFGSIHDPEQRAKLIDIMAANFSEVTENVYRSNTAHYLEGKAAELERRVKTESTEKIFPVEPKTQLKNFDLEHARQQARKAVPQAVMQKTDDFVKEKGKKIIQPFIHYSSRPGDSENNAVRLAKVKDGEIDWTGVKVSKKAKQKVQDLYDLLDVMPKYHGTVYRGCSFAREADMQEYINKLMNSPETLMEFISTTPDPVVAHHYASANTYRVIVVVPNVKNAVYFGPYSAHPEDEEALISYKFCLSGLKTYKRNGIVYVIAEEIAR